MYQIRALSLATTVYYIWMERNGRIFNQRSNTWQVVLQKIDDSLKEATWFWRAKRNYQNWSICREWGLSDCELLV